MLLGLLASVVTTLSPASASTALPRILLTGGAAEVARTYTATAVGDWPADTTRSYQWYRGDHVANADSFVPIDGATGTSYKLTDADHWHTIKVSVRVLRNGYQIGETHSGASNWIMYNMAPPVLSGVPEVGHTITATLGNWAQEWETKLWWRNTGIPIPGETGLTYTLRPADAGKEISLLAIGEYTFPNGVHPIDRYASRMRISWGTKSIVRAAAPAARQLAVTAIAYVPGGRQADVRGLARVYDNNRFVRQVSVAGGRKTFSVTGLRPGSHAIKMVFLGNPWYARSATTRTFQVH